MNNTSEQIMTKYLKNIFDLNSEYQADLLDEMPIWSAPFGLKLLDNIKLKKNISALDIGFGVGFPLTEIALRLGKTCKIYGIDPWEAAIKRAKRKLEFYEITNVEIIQGEAENIPLKDNSIDLITSNNGINNVSDMPKVMDECARIMKPGGQFIQTMNLDSSMVEFYDIFKNTLKEENLADLVRKVDEHIYKKRKPLNEVISLLEEKGFQVKNIIHDKFEYKFVDGTTFLNHYFMRLAFMDRWKKIIPEDRLQKIFSIIENKINIKAEKKGLFRLSIPFVVIDCERK